MAKKPRVCAPETTVDDDGYETDGMYRWGGPRVPLTLEAVEKWVEDWNNDFRQPAINRIGDFRELLTQMIAPFVDGPFQPEACKGMFGRTIVRLNLTTGSGLYAFHKGVSPKSYLDDATGAIHELDALSKLISDDLPKIDSVVRVSIRVGMLTERAILRAEFADDVLLAQTRRKVSARGGKATTVWSAELDTLARAIFAGIKRPRVSYTAAYQRTSAKLAADHGISVSPSTIRRHLDNRSNAER